MPICRVLPSLAILLGLCLSAIGVSNARAQSPSSTLIWRGDVATASGVMQTAAPAWENAGYGSIELQPFNTASGIDAVFSGSADLAGSARASSGSAEDAQLTFTPVAWDALVIVVQKSNPVNSLTLKQIHDIYYGRIHNWAEVGGANAPIDLYAVASPGDGVEYSLRSLLFGRGTQPVAAPRLYVNTNKLEEAVALNPNGMGASTLSDIRGKPALKALSIGGTPPTAEALANCSYPLFTPLYIVINPTSPRVHAAQAFIDFLASDRGRATLRRNDILPYSDGGLLVASDLFRRDKIRTEATAPELLTQTYFGRSN